MKIAITGATGFLGRYIVAALASQHLVRCWHRPRSDVSGFDAVENRIEWLVGELGDVKATQKLVAGCDAIVHAALHHPGGGFRGGEGNIVSLLRQTVHELVDTANSA